MALTIGQCGPLIAHMCMYKMEVKFVSAFELTREERVCELCVAVLAKVEAN